MLSRSVVTELDPRRSNAPSAQRVLSARQPWPLRLAAVIAVSLQIIASISGVWLLGYWICASVALVD